MQGLPLPSAVPLTKTLNELFYSLENNNMNNSNFKPLVFLPVSRGANFAKNSPCSIPQDLPV